MFLVEAIIEIIKNNVLIGYVELAKSEGAKIEYGGERVIVPGECANGWYLTPAVVTGCSDDMRFVQVRSAHN